MRECNATAQKQQINSANYTSTFNTSIRIDEQQLIAMMNTDATENFMSQSLTRDKEFTTRRKKDFYDLIVIDENSLFNENERVNEETISLSIAIQQHHEKFIFDIVEMIIHDIVLNMS